MLEDVLLCCCWCGCSELSGRWYCCVRSDELGKTTGRFDGSMDLTNSRGEGGQEVAFVMVCMVVRWAGVRLC